MRQYDLYGIGSALVDTEIVVSEEFQKQSRYKKGHMSLVSTRQQEQLLTQLGAKPDQITLACGGSAANTIISHSCFGGRSFFSCIVGDDKDGQFYQDSLMQAKVDTNAQISTTGITGKCLITITPDGERTMHTYMGVNEQLDTNAIDEEALSTSRYLYLESYLLGGEQNYRAVTSACLLCREAGTKIALSLSDPSMVNNFPDRMRNVIDSGIDVVFCNEEEALCYTGCAVLDEAIKVLNAKVPHVVVTRGKHGALIRKDGITTTVKAYSTDALDTSGAGDMFAGAYMYAMLRGFETGRSGDFAAFCAMNIVSRYGPRLTPEEYRQLLRSYEHRGGQ